MKKQLRHREQNDKYILEELEPRQLFSGGIEGLVVNPVESPAATYLDIDSGGEQTSAQSDEESITSAAEQQTHEIVFVDTGVENYQALVDDLLNSADTNRNIEVVLLDSDRNGIEQISETLQNKDDLDAIHIISHGSDGSIQLGNSNLDAEALTENYLKISLWANAFSESGDILIYGCNLAATDLGQSLINELSELTLTDVAASDDLTGAASQGGDWALEFSVGQVESKIAVSAELQQEYQGTFATYTVTSLADSGTGSLREAITLANAAGGTDTIEFGVAGTINLSSALPSIGEELAIDGSTAPGYSGDPVVNLDGSGVSGNGLRFTSGADNSSVNALMITNFTGNGIQIDSGADGIIITGNWIGTTGTGTTGDGNSNNGINVQGANAVIGGTGANEGNVITNNGNEGINLTGTGATGTLIQGNIIGLDPDGVTGSGNGDVGIALLSGSHNTTIGGTDPNARNIISMNYEGIEINSNNNTIQGNYIGTDITGTQDRGNRSDDGIEIQNNATGNLIGGTAPGAGNLIAFNALDGVNIVSGSGNTVLGNEIHSNGDKDIDLAAGANSNQTAPVLASALTNGSQINITGSLVSVANSFFRIEFFGANQTYLGYANVATDGAGNVTIDTMLTANVASGDLVTATATKSEVTFTSFTETSEISTSINAVTTNFAPVAVADSVTMGENTSVLIDVLANDTDPEGDPMTASIISGPSNGTLVPNPVVLVNETNVTNTTFDDREGSWSPDGTKIVFRSDRDGDNEIYVMDADGSNVVQLTSNTTWSDVRPDWSPDGSQIVFGSDRDGNKDIWVMDADGLNQTNLTDNTANNATASWSPDGTKIVFHSNMDGDIAIYVMDADGANQTQITNNTGVVDNGGSFSPDGTQIVFTSDRDGNKEVYVMDANGSNQTRLTNAAGTDGNAVWSPDGNKILFKSIRDGDNEIYVMDADGSNQIQITNNTSHEGSPDWSPDGTRILFHSDQNDPGVSSQIYVTDISSDGTFTYTPNAGFTGTDSFTYVANDGTLDSAVTTVTITVDTPANITGDVSYSGNEGDAVAGDLNATDVNGLTDTTYFTVTTQASNGTAVIDEETGAWTFTPTDPNWFGSDSFTVTVTDDLGGTTTQLVSVTLTAINDAPVAVTDLAVTNEDTSVLINVLTNDSDAEGDPMYVLDVGNPANGTVVNNGDGTVTYTPDTNFSGADSFTYLVSDLSGITGYWGLDGNATDSVGGNNGTITGATTVAGVTGNALSFDKVDDKVVIPNIAINDSFSLSFQIKIDDNSGSDYQYIYSHGPVNNPNSLNIFLGETGSGYANMLYTQFNDANDIDDRTALEFDLSSIIGDGLWHTYTLTVETGSGSNVYLDGTLQNSDARGGDSFNPTTDIYLGTREDLNTNRYFGGSLDSVQIFDRALDAGEVSDVHTGGTALGTVNITVNAVNDAPVATGNTVIASEDVPLVIGSGNFSFTDVESDALASVTITGLNLNGGTLTHTGGTVPVTNGMTVTAAQLADLTFTSASNDSTNSSFTYTVNDADLGITSATMNITVTQVDDAGSFAGNISATTNEDTATAGAVTFADAVDGFTTANFSINTAASNGVAAIDAAGNWTYTPTANYNGADSFTVQVTDDDGNVETQVISITVTAVNDAPVIAVDPSPILYLSGTMAIDPALTVTDVDDTTLESAQVSFGSGYLRGQDRLLFVDQLGITGSFDINSGILTLTGNASVADYQTALRSVQYEDFNPTPAQGVLYVDFSVSDGTDTSLIDTRVLEIVDNMPPRAGDDLGTVAEGASVVIDLAANDTDADDLLDLGSIVIISGPTNGSLVINGDGTVTYTHNGGETTSDNFTYTIKDTGGTVSNEAPVTITVTAVNDVPVATGNTVIASEDVALIIGVSDFSFTDTELDSLASVTITGLNLNGGTLTHTGGSVPVTNGMTITAAQLADLTFTSASNDSTDSSFTYTVNDAGTGTTSAVMNITVNAVNDVPVATGNTVIASEDVALIIGVSDFSFTDTELDSLASVTITGLNLNGGTLTHTGGSVPVTNGMTITAAQLADLTFTSASNDSTDSSFTYTVNDAGTGTTSAVMNITVNAVNDVPVATGNTVIASEDVALIIGVSDFSFTDTELDSLASVTITGLNLNGGTLTHTGGSVPVTNGMTITAAQLADLTFTSASNDSTDSSFTYTVNDAGTGTTSAVMNITVNAVNDVPVATGNTVIASEDVALIIGVSDFSFTDTELDSLASVTITGLNLNGGTLTHTGGSVPVTNGMTITAAQLADLTFTSASNDSTDSSFTYTVNDAGTGTTSAVMNITVNAVNDVPVATGNTVIASEDVALIIGVSDFSFTDTELDSLASVTITGLNLNGGTLTHTGGSVPVTNGMTITAAQLADLTFTSASNDSTDSSFTYTVNDAGTGTTSAVMNITVNAVNDVPVATGNTVIASEDVALIIGVSDFSFTDTELDSLASVTITGLNLNGGTLTHTGGSVPVTNGMTITAAQLADLTFTSASNDSTDSSFTYTVNDAGTGTTSAVMNITVNAVNDVPVATGNTVIASEDVALIIGVSDFSFTDTELDSLASVTITGLNLNGGTLTHTGGSVPVTNGMTITAAQLADLTFTSASNDSTDSSFTYTVNDAGTGTTSAVMNITVNAVNDVPVATGNTVIASEDVALIIGVSDFSFTDTELDSLASVTITGLNLNGGTLTHTGGSVPVTNGMTITAAQLADLTFTSASNDSTDSSFTYTVNDAGTGVTSAVMNITVNAVNDVPVATGNTVIASEDVALIIGVSDFSFTDTELDSLASVTITGLNLNGGTLTHTGGSVPVTNGMTITAAQLADLTFTSASNDSTDSSFTYTVNDAGTGVTSAVMNITVNAVNDVPVATGNTVIASEDVALIIGVSDFSFTDTELDSLASVTITGLNLKRWYLNPHRWQRTGHQRHDDHRRTTRRSDLYLGVKRFNRFKLYLYRQRCRHRCHFGGNEHHRQCGQ